MDNNQLARMLQENTDAITKLTIESAEVKDTVAKLTDTVTKLTIESAGVRSGLKSLETKVDLKFEIVEGKIEDVKTDVAAKHNFMFGVMGVGFSALVLVIVFATFVFTATVQ